MRNGFAAILMAGLLAVQPAAAATLLKLPTYADGGGQTRPWRLVASKWSVFSRLLQAAGQDLERCPGAPPDQSAGLLISPNRFDRGAARALDNLRACRPADFAGSAPQTVPDALWIRLFPGEPLPTPLDRVKVLAAGAAVLTPDYDRAVWDWERGAGSPDGDPGAIFTWGPFKATAGYGCTLQKALSALMDAPASAQAVRMAFAGEEALLAQLLDRSDPAWCGRQAAILKPVFLDGDRREGFKSIFTALGARAEVRAGYDAYFLGPSGYLAGRMARYYLLWEKVGLRPTEVDFAFFLDRSLDYPPLSDALIADLVPKIMQAGADNWRTRRTLALQTPFTSPQARTFQIGRDAVYWIDAAGGQAGLSPEEQDAWVRNSRIKASDVGLRERPYTPPCTHLFRPGCPAGATP